METVLITGANRGLGLEFVRQYNAADWRVFACCREPTGAAARDLNMLAGVSGRRVTVHRLDVANHAQVDQLAQSLKRETIDVLINNAGVQGPSEDFGKTDYKRFAQTLATNVLAPMKVAEAFADHLAASQRKVLATISSRMGSIGLTAGDTAFAYRTSKAAANMVAKNLAGLLGPRGITVLALSPGWVKTDMGGANATLDAPTSVAAVRAIIARATIAESGKFLHYDGTELPW